MIDDSVISALHELSAAELLARCCSLVERAMIEYGLRHCELLILLGTPESTLKRHKNPAHVGLGFKLNTQAVIPQQG